MVVILSILIAIILFPGDGSATLQLDRTGLIMSNTDINRGTPSSDEQPTGSWGGSHIGLELTEAGGRVEFDCAHGTIDKKLVLDAVGKFNVAGTYVEEHGGPVRESEKISDLRVIYSGRVRNKTMSLTVRRADNNKLIGTFTLISGQEAFIVKCR